MMLVFDSCMNANDIDYVCFSVLLWSAGVLLGNRKHGQLARRLLTRSCHRLVNATPDDQQYAIDMFTVIAIIVSTHY